MRPHPVGSFDHGCDWSPDQLTEVIDAGVLTTPRSHRTVTAAVWGAVFVVPAAFQLLYGIRDVGLVEEWGVIQRFDQIGAVFWTPLDHIGLNRQSIRPLTVAPHALAYVFDSDSFVWYHILNALALGLKGVAMLAFLLRLGIRRSTAVAGSVIFALFPAWTGLFTFRSIHAQFAMVGLVFALSELLRFYERPSIKHGVLIALGLALSLLTYEVGYIAIMLAPLLLLSWGRPSRNRFLQAAAVWFVVPVINGFRILLLLRSDTPLYERDLATGGSRDPLTKFVDLSERIYRDGLGGFIDGPNGMTIAVWTVLLTILIVADVIYSSWRESGASSVSARPVASLSDRALLVLTIAAFVSAPVVSMIYISQEAHLTDPLRIFSIASLPLTLAVVGVVEILARRRYEVGVVLCTLLLISTLGSATALRDHWHRLSVLQEDVLGAIVAVRASAPEKPDVVVVDRENLIGDVYTLLPDILPQALADIMPATRTVLLCHTLVGQLEVQPAPGTGCSIADGEVTNGTLSASVESASIIEIRTAEAGAGWSGDPVSVAGARIRSMVSCVGDGTCDSGSAGVQARLVPAGELP